MTFLPPILIIASLISYPFLPPAQSVRTPFSIRISPQHDVEKSGSEILIGIALTNTSNHEISLGKAPGTEPLAESEYIVDVYVQKDQLAPQTEYGRKLKQNKLWFRSRDSVSLQPGDSVKDGVIISKLYDLSRPGKYSIQLSRKVPPQLGGGIVKSNTITITVTE